MKSLRPILFVDDDEDELFMVRHAFRKAGAEGPVVLLRDGAQAIHYLKEKLAHGEHGQLWLPALIVTDLKMGVVDGFGLLEWMRAQDALKHIPIVVLTNSDSQSDRERSRQLGASEYCVKPSRLAELVTMAEGWRKKMLRKEGTERTISAYERKGDLRAVAAEPVELRVRRQG